MACYSYLHSVEQDAEQATADVKVPCYSYRHSADAKMPSYYYPQGWAQQSPSVDTPK